MKLFGILEGIGIIILIASIILSIVTGIDDQRKEIWFLISMLGVFLWALICMPRNSKWNLPVRYKPFVEIPDFIQLHGLILWVIIAGVLIITVLSLFSEPIVGYDSILPMSVAVMVNIKMIGLYYRGGIRCVINFTRKR